VIVFVQENKTTDYYFPVMAKWGAKVAVNSTLLAQAPNFDQTHDRSAWVHARMGDYQPLDVQVNSDAVIPFYSFLAKQFVFADHHFGVGSNSTPGHMLAIGGQVPTLKNPRFTGPHPVWDIPSIFSVAESSNVTWGAWPDESGYPTKFYKSINESNGVANIHGPKTFIPMAKAGELPELCYVWSPSGFDEHPPHVSDPAYVRNGHDLVWSRVQAVIDGGGWADTTFILTWDDWGGYADSVQTPVIETVPDALHPEGFAVIGGSRIPLIMFGGSVEQAIDTQWHSHASIPKTVIDLLGLPAMGVPRVDEAPSLARHVKKTLSRPVPPAFGTTIKQPRPPRPAPVPPKTKKWAGPLNQPMPDLVVLNGSAIPAPTDGTVRPKPPKPLHA
jgi:hypothetical protein